MIKAHPKAQRPNTESIQPETQTSNCGTGCGQTRLLGLETLITRAGKLNRAGKMLQIPKPRTPLFKMAMTPRPAAEPFEEHSTPAIYYGALVIRIGEFVQGLCLLVILILVQVSHPMEILNTTKFRV